MLESAAISRPFITHEQRVYDKTMEKRGIKCYFTGCALHKAVAGSGVVVDATVVDPELL